VRTILGARHVPPAVWGQRRTLGVLFVGMAVLGVDLALTLLQGGRATDLIERMVVLLFSVPAITWYAATWVARRSRAREEALHERQESLLRNISDLIFVVDHHGLVTYQSPSAERALGYQPGDLLGTNIENLVSAAEAPNVRELVGGLGPDARGHVECQIRQRDGRFLAVDVVATQVSDDERVDGLVLTMHDVSRWKELKEQLTRQAYHDPLTGLPNRTLYIDRLEHALARRRRHARRIAVLFLDLDDFNTVNDSLGHDVGDRLIGDVAARLLGAIRPGDTAARLGGDEFAILLEDVDEDQATTVANRVLGEFESPFDLGDRSLLVGVSVGVALSSEELTTSADMLRAADTAMYEAKAAGKGQYRLFETSMHRASTERLRLGADLRGAVDRGEFVVHYQPIVDLPGGRASAMEALVRWAHPERGLLPPSEFVPLAERSGVIVQIGSFVLGEACRQARAWQGHLRDRRVGVNVNVSPVELQDPGYVASVALALEAAELGPDLLTLEITENVMALDDPAVERRLSQLKGLGVRLAIDDFGTGYSSLGSIARFPVDEIKIDKSFIDSLGSEPQQLALVRAIVRLAKSLKLATVAEGVEREEQSTRLAAAGCERAQGYVFSKPLDARQANAYLVGHTTLTLWMGYSEQELSVVESVVADFNTRNPTIRVDVVGGVSDERIVAALRAGDVPNVISSFDSGSFGTFAAAGGLVDLTPYLERDGIDEEIFTEATRTYTRRGSKRWALPMLADAYGLYYNRDLFAAAGLSGPPRTMTELTAFAKRLTKRRPDGSLEVVGFNPLIGFYENGVSHFGHQFGARWLGDTGESCVASDPAWAKMLRWQKDLVDWYGYDELVRFGHEVGREFSAANAFEAGRLGMCLDGEWRIAFIAANGSSVPFATAPVPVDDVRPELYGSGFINGTIVGIPASAGQQDEAWELIKYLTTDDSALVKLSNGLRNIPSTYAGLRSPDLARDANLTVFMDIFAHPRSVTPPITPAGPSHEEALAAFASRWQGGAVRDLTRGLQALEREMNASLRVATGTERRSDLEAAAWQRATGAGPDLLAAFSR
jgi:diguanylate cyclase (GGDEF)-like protein/PAS domain S-box-containing protein